jgi:phage-related minor tail protein
MARWNPADETLTVAAHQAAGIVAEQAHCDIREAFRQLITRSAAIGQSLDDTALDVIDHVVRFDE